SPETADMYAPTAVRISDWVQMTRCPPALSATTPASQRNNRRNHMILPGLGHLSGSGKFSRIVFLPETGLKISGLPEALIFYFYPYKITWHFCFYNLLSPCEWPPPQVRNSVSSVRANRPAP